jgi:mycothiol synthase
VDVPSGFRLRPPGRPDLAAVAGVLIADELADAGMVTLGARFVEAEWSRPGFDLRSDAWVAVDPGEIVVGYAQVRREEPGVTVSWGVVDPAHRGRGIGSALLDRIEQRAEELTLDEATVRFSHAINAGDLAAAALLHARGLRPAHHFWHMQIDLEGSIDAGRAPDGVQIAVVDPTVDLATVHGVLDEAFIDDRSHHLQPLAAWLAEETSAAGYDPTLWLLAHDHGEPVGALTGSVDGGGGWVDYLGVRPAARGRGIGLAMLRHAFAMLADRGARRVLLSVDAENPTGATAVYERVGMRIVKRWDRWERRSRDDGRPPTHLRS